MKCTIGTASPPGPGHDSPSPNTLKSSITASVYIPPSATAPLSKPSPTADSAPPPDQHTNETLSKNLDTAQGQRNSLSGSAGTGRSRTTSTGSATSPTTKT